MNVVGQHDRARLRFFENAITHCGRPGSLPIVRIDVPKNDLISELIVNPTFLARRNGSIRWSQQNRSRASSLFDCVVGSLHLAAHPFIRHFAEIRMRPAMISNFMTFARGPCDDFGMFYNIFTDYEESCFSVVSGEAVQKLWGERSGGTGIQGCRDVRTCKTDRASPTTHIGRALLAALIAT